MTVGWSERIPGYVPLCRVCSPARAGCLKLDSAKSSRCKFRLCRARWFGDKAGRHTHPQLEWDVAHFFLNLAWSQEVRHCCSSIFLFLPALDREGCARFRTLRQPARSKGPNPSLTAHAATCYGRSGTSFLPLFRVGTMPCHPQITRPYRAGVVSGGCLFFACLNNRFFIVSGADSPRDQIRVILATPGELNVALTHTALVPVFLQRVLRAPLQNGRTGRGKGSADAAPDVGRRARG